eukprot:GILK01002706.1.p1 GENE.GILK01002706.1~~GILK01002706.1.p1  ORF type:complete len:330 (-),score=57.45 GILK01002706.1:31-1020(-)
MSMFVATRRVAARATAPNSSLSVKYGYRCFSASGKQVGFIGLGNMGSRMASNLLKNGHSLVVYDLNKEAVNKLAQQGAKSASSIAELAQQVDTLITMLPSSPHVKSTYTSSTGIFANGRPGALLIDSSTIDPNVAKEVAAEAKSKHFKMVDAPVSGGVGGAEAGTLTFMVGGDSEHFKMASEYLKFMGKNLVYCGGAGTGQIAKVCNNLLLGISMAGAAEAMGLGQKLGIDPKVLASIINTSSGRCWSTDTYNPCPGVMENVPSSRGYTGGFACDLMLKDMGLALSAAKATDWELKMGDEAYNLYKSMSEKGKGLKDFSGVFEHIWKAK